MCGIFAIQTDHQNAAESTLTALKTLEYRGYDSWGVAWCEAPKPTAKSQQPIAVEKHIGKIGTVVLSSKLSAVSSLAIGHTRWATHGGVTEANAHPHLDCTGRFAIVHNGIVENFAELKANLIQLGHRFKSETDSEVIAHLIEHSSSVILDAESSEGRPGDRGSSKQETRESVRAVFKQLKGLNAIVVLDRETETIIACKQGSPLIVGKDLVLASDAIALLPHTDQVHYVEDGEMVVIERSSLKIFDIESGEEKQFVWKPIERGNTETVLGSYEHFMRKEIDEQSDILNRLSILHPSTGSGQVFPFSIHARRVWFVSCGSAYYAGLYGQYLALDHGIDARAVVGSEFGQYLMTLRKSDQVIFLSQSGETIDLVEHAKVLKEKKIPMLGIINREGSTLERLCNAVIHINAGPEQCVLATKSWTAKIAVLTELFGHPTERVVHIDPLLDSTYQKDVIHPIAKRLVTARNIFIIGRGRQFPLALETALKIKEVTYIHAEAQAGGELKHGSIALIEEGTPVIVFALPDETREEIISNAMEVKARGAYIIGISDRPHECFDVTIQIGEKLGNPYLASIIPMQILAYEMAVLLGRDPDKPRNLAKSVTVK